MTDEEQAKQIAENTEAYKKAIKARKEEEIKAGFLNPFGECTNYSEFLKQVEKSKLTVSEYCDGKLTEDQIVWLEKDIAIFNKNQKA